MKLTGTDPARAARLMRLASVASVAVAVTLIVLKSVVWFRTDSVAILSSLIDSLMDAGASLINLLAVRHSLTPPDAEHRFGHGKAEALAGLGQAAFIAGSAGFLIFQAVDRLLHPVPLQQGELGIAVMVVSIVLTFGLVVFQKYVTRRTGSLAIGADSLHYVGDLLTNVAVIVALVLATRFGLTYADPLFAIGIAFYILHAAWGILRESFDHLMDRELPDEMRARIRDIALAHPEVRALHDLRTRAAGTSHFIQLHLEMDGGMTLTRAHRIAEEVEERIRAAFPGAEVIVHQDPEGVDEIAPDRVEG
ncbi:MAG: cation diffusion facilitator family transporter [Alphaproteobacteria bacterium]|nr:cation diffusion facilitator family transporter [Alphaproteobacteria bacterium]